MKNKKLSGIFRFETTVILFLIALSLLLLSLVYPEVRNDHFKTFNLLMVGFGLASLIINLLEMIPEDGKTENIEESNFDRDLSKAAIKYGFGPLSKEDLSFLIEFKPNNEKVAQEMSKLSFKAGARWAKVYTTSQWVDATKAVPSIEQSLTKVEQNVSRLQSEIGEKNNKITKLVSALRSAKGFVDSGDTIGLTKIKVEEALNAK